MKTYQGSGILFREHGHPVCGLEGKSMMTISVLHSDILDRPSQGRGVITCEACLSRHRLSAVWIDVLDRDRSVPCIHSSIFGSTQQGRQEESWQRAALMKPSGRISEVTGAWTPLHMVAFPARCQNKYPIMETPDDTKTQVPLQRPLGSMRQCTGQDGPGLTIDSTCLGWPAAGQG